MTDKYEPRVGDLLVYGSKGRYMGNEWDVEAIFFEPVQNSAKII